MKETTELKQKEKTAIIRIPLISRHLMVLSIITIIIISSYVQLILSISVTVISSRKRDSNMLLLFQIFQILIQQ